MDVSSVLLDILVVLVAAKLAAELAERIHVPAVVCEIVAGVLIGPSVIGLVGGHNSVLAVLGEIGVILLLLDVGLEMNLRELGAVGKASMLVAVVGVVGPMAGGFAVTKALGESTNAALFLGSALAATSVGITARVFSDLRALSTVEARTVLGAAVADDVFGLVILTIVVRTVTEGSVSVLDVVSIIGIAVAFLVVASVVGTRVGPPLFQFLHRSARSAGTVVALALAFTLAFAKLADAAKLAPIVGAFVAGLSLSRSTVRERIARELTPVGHLFIPVFFLEIGIAVDVKQFAKPGVLRVAGALFVVAVLGKIAAAAGATGSPGDKRLIGLAMIPRGEVGLIFATIGLREHVFGTDLYASLLLVVLATTLVAPPLLRWRLGQIRARAISRPGSSPVPEGGWLQTRDGTVEIQGDPPTHLALSLGFDAARRVADVMPGSRLLDWFGRLPDEPLRWDRGARTAFFDVLRAGNERSWRFLDRTGLLARALPDLADVLALRHADPFIVDPTQTLRWAIVEELHDVTVSDPVAARTYAALEHPEWLVLAALILDMVGSEEVPVELGRRIAKRLDLGAAAEEEIALLVGDQALLRASALRLESVGEEQALRLAIHLDRPERARALYLLSLALGALDEIARRRLDALLETLLTLLEQPELTGLDARNLVERRRAEAARLVEGDVRANKRIAHAPRPYLVSQDAADVARQVRLLEPLPDRGVVRVAAIQTSEHEWKIEVAARDRTGLLATISGVLAANGYDIHDAVVATWDDGGALDSFLVHGERSPDTDALASAIVASFKMPLVAPESPELEVRFDDHVSPWYTVCEVRGPDRPGLLHAIAVGLAHAGTSVHSAQLATDQGRAVDRFELTDRHAQKLGEPMKESVVAAIAGGVTGRRRRFSRR